MHAHIMCVPRRNQVRDVKRDVKDRPPSAQPSKILTIKQNLRLRRADCSDLCISAWQRNSVCISVEFLFQSTGQVPQRDRILEKIS